MPWLSENLLYNVMIGSWHIASCCLAPRNDERSVAERNHCSLYIADQLHASRLVWRRGCCNVLEP